MILYDFPARSIYSKKVESQIKLYTGSSGINPGRGRYLALRNSRSNLPDEITIKWQLAELTDCSEKVAIRSRPGYYRTYNCGWQLLPNKFFEKTINLKKYKDSEAFKNKGKFTGWKNLNRRTATIVFDFNDEEIIIKTQAGKTNWMQ